MPGTFPPPPQVSDPDMHHGTWVTHMPLYLPGSLALKDGENTRFVYPVRGPSHSIFDLVTYPCPWYLILAPMSSYVSSLTICIFATWKVSNSNFHRSSSVHPVFNLSVKIQICRISFSTTVYPKKYAHGFCFAVLCCGYTLTDFPISTRLTSLALWQSNDCPSASKATLMNMDKYFMWIHYGRLHNHNKAKHNKTVCIFLGIYCNSARRGFTWKAITNVIIL